MDWSQVTALTIPEGSVKQVSVNGVILWRKGLLPSGYTQLGYIESTGTQYLIIPYIVNNNTSVFCRYLQTANGDETASVIFGVTSTPHPTIANYGCLRLVNGTSQFDRVGWGSNTAKSTINIKGYNNLNQWYDIFYDLNNIYIDDTLVATSSTPISEVWQAQYDLGLFARNGYSVTMKAKAKIASFWAKENGKYVLNLIPAMRNSDSEVGMYDTVTGQFFTNAGTGTFIAGPRFVKYIESTGTQFINTGIIPNQDDIWVEVDCQKQVNAPSEGIVFSIILSNSPPFNINLYQASQVYFRYGSVNTFKNMTNTVRHKYKMTPTGIYIDNTLSISVTNTSSFVGNTNTICLFGRFGSSANNSVLYPLVGKLYGFKFGRGDTLIQDLRPCLDGNNVACMYDMVSGTYFYNQGTGEFIAGGTV